MEVQFLAFASENNLNKINSGIFCFMFIKPLCSRKKTSEMSDSLGKWRYNSSIPDIIFALKMTKQKI